MATVLNKALWRVQQIASDYWGGDRVFHSLGKNSHAVVLYDDEKSREEASRFSKAYPGFVVITYDMRSLDVAELRERLKRIKTLDAIIDATNNSGSKREFIFYLLYHLRENGVYLTTTPDAETSSARELINQLCAIQKKPGFDFTADSMPQKHHLPLISEPEGAVAQERLAAAIKNVRYEKGYVVIRRNLKYMLKARESSFTANFMAARELDWASETEHGAGGVLESKAALKLNLKRFQYRFPKRFTYPPLKLRVYENVIATRRQVLYRGNLMLPDTFRLNGLPYLRSVTTQDTNVDFVRNNFAKPKKKLSGAYYYLDTEFPGVYGHLVTEIVGRLWAWDIAKEQEPNLKVIMCKVGGKPDIASWMRVALNAYGIPNEDIVVLEQPTLLEKVYAPTPQFVNYEGGYVHPQILPVWERLRDNLLADATLEESPTKIFLGRAEGGDRECRNGSEVEALFENNGFTVLRPELYSLPDQAVLFNNATAIAGWGGSGQLTAILASGPKKRLVINPWSHHPINEYLISSIYGDEITYLYQEPETTKTTAEYPRGPFHSPYTFDFDRDGKMLKDFIQSAD
jgi:capsular polysaccharide biosynthesis protein